MLAGAEQIGQRGGAQKSSFCTRANTGPTLDDGAQQIGMLGFAQVVP